MPLTDPELHTLEQMEQIEGNIHTAPAKDCKPGIRVDSGCDSSKALWNADPAASLSSESDGTIPASRRILFLGLLNIGDTFDRASFPGEPSSTGCTWTRSILGQVGPISTHRIQEV
jgi:hypothetical protein